MLQPLVQILQRFSHSAYRLVQLVRQDRQVVMEVMEQQDLLDLLAPLVQRDRQALLGLPVRQRDSEHQRPQQDP